MGRPTNSLYMGTQAVAAVRLARLIALAERLGHTQTRGAGAGKLGSASALCAAIADGKVLAIQPPDGDAVALVAALEAGLSADYITSEQQDVLRDVIAQIQAQIAPAEKSGGAKYYTPPHVYDAVAGSGAYLHHITEQVVGNPPPGESD